MLLKAGGLTVGREADDVQQLWAAVLREAPRMRTPFDEVWLAGLLAERGVTRQVSEVPREATTATPAVRLVGGGPVEGEQDWGAAPAVPGFVGRAEELATLREWVLDERCRLVAVLGMGGIGKTVLAARVAQDVTPKFERLFWRTVRDALPISDWLAGAIGFLSGQQVVAPEGEGAQLRALLQLLHDRPSLLILDNFETLLQPGDPEGRYREGYAGYGRLLQAVGEGRHRSCLLVTSREAPAELAKTRGSGVRILQLGGLGAAEAQILLADRRLSGNTDEWASLVDRFGGNGLALKVVGDRIRELFGRELGAFLNEASWGTVFGGIRRLLAEQIERSSALEQRVLQVLAVEREPVTIAQLIGDFGPRLGRGAVLEAAEALLGRSLVERAETPGPAAFTLQSVVLEYVTDRLVEQVGDEISRGKPMLLVDQPLIKAQAKDYVRYTQERLIGDPILRQLQADHGPDGAEQRLLSLLESWRARSHAEQGCGPGNVVNLLRLLRGDLRRVDLSRLAIRHAYLAQVDAQDASLAGANLAEAALAQAFNFPVCVALSRDGALLVAGTSAGQVWLWRVADRTPILALKAHIGPVDGVAVSEDGRVLASGGEDGTVGLWELPGGRLMATLLGHSGGVRSVAFDAGGRLLASASHDGTVRLWEIPGGRLLATLQGHTGPVFTVGLSLDGRLLASGGMDGTVRLWDVSAARPLATLQGHTGTVWAVALSTDARLLATGGMDGTVRLWDLPGGQPVGTLQGHTGTVWSVALSASGRLLASASEDGTARLWQVPGGQPLATLQRHTGTVISVALSADGKLVASGGFDGTVRLWEGSTGRLLATVQGHAGGIWGIASSADGQLLACGSEDGTVRLWEVPRGRLLATLEGHAGTVVSVALTADGRLLASGGMDGTVRLWDRSRRRLLATLRGHTDPVFGVALSADGRLLASGSFDGTVRLWAAPAGRLLATLPGHTGLVWSVALSADGELLASGSIDGTIRVWQTRSGQPLAIVDAHTGPVYGVALSADGRLLASGSFDGTSHLWEIPNGRPLAALQGHIGPVFSVALSPDGRLLASGGMDGTMRLWKADSGQLLAELEGHTGPVYGVALSADGRLLGSGSFDGTVRLWDASNSVCLRTLRSDRRYERLDFTGLTGVTDAQHAALLALGAVEA